MWSKGAANAHFTIDLKSVTLRPTYFAYRNDHGGGGNHPRTFELQGSNDGTSWAALSRHSGETWPQGAKAWPVSTGDGSYFKLFRIQNLGSPNHLCCSGIELYGLVRGAPPAASAAASSSVAAIPIVIATAVEEGMASAVPGVAAHAAQSAHGEPTLVEIVSLLRRELGVKGTNLAETVEAAVVELGLQRQVEGSPLINKARECWTLLGSPPTSEAVVRAEFRTAKPSFAPSQPYKL